MNREHPTRHRAKIAHTRVRMEGWRQRRLGWAEKFVEWKKTVEKSKNLTGIGLLMEGMCQTLVIVTLDGAALSGLGFLFYFDRHMTELLVDSFPPPQWPPIIKINLHRPPHRYPSSNRKTLPRNGCPSARLVT